LTKKSCFYISFATEELRSALLAVEDVQRLLDLPLMARENYHGIKFFAGEYVSGKLALDWSQGLRPSSLPWQSSPLKVLLHSQAEFHVSLRTLLLG
jgi:hypothetical protein